ncbi:MAG: hypothetical protein NTV60_00520 [Candidatus Kaiserbacteria bacterium]|nr:hypothetical protein [Candidatus Kaiserbacteria bacterium]
MTTFLWVIAIIIGVSWVANYLKETRPESPDEEELDTCIKGVVADTLGVNVPGRVIKEDVVFKRQSRFEDFIRQTARPDALSGKEIYIYINLMRVWYQKLVSEHRYEETLTQKIRGDWLDYMQAKEDMNTYSFLAMDAEEAKVKSYNQEEELAARKAWAIEDAFAAAIGKEATTELTRIRAKNSMSEFDYEGNLAPEGFERDTHGKFVPIKPRG